MNETANPSRDTGTSATTPHQAVILAGGRGMRLHPYTHVTNKCLLKVHGQTLIEKQIGILRDQLGVTSLVIVLGYLGDQIRTAVGDGSALGVEVRYVEVERVEDGPAAGLLRARDLIDGPFFLMLGDEYFNSSRHDRLLDWILERRPDALLTFTRPLNPHQILALGHEDILADIPGERTREPVYDSPARWIDPPPAG